VNVTADPARLQSYGVFSTLTVEECEKVAHWAEEVDVDPGTVLAPEGESGYWFFVIEDGEADVRHGDRTVRRLGPGDHFGELAILGQGRRTATVVAATPMTLLRFFGMDFRQLEAEFPQVAEAINSEAKQWQESDQV
jgi:CRP-like cAMP-binding protein